MIMNVDAEICARVASILGSSGVCWIDIEAYIILRMKEWNAETEIDESAYPFWPRHNAITCLYIHLVECKLVAIGPT